MVVVLGVALAASYFVPINLGVVGPQLANGSQLFVKLATLFKGKLVLSFVVYGVSAAGVAVALLGGADQAIEPPGMYATNDFSAGHQPAPGTQPNLLVSTPRNPYSLDGSNGQLPQYHLGLGTRAPAAASSAQPVASAIPQLVEAIIDRIDEVDEKSLWDKVCFVAGTLVETRRGRIAIEDLSIGDQVTSCHLGADGPACILKPIVKVMSHETSELVYLAFADGAPIQVTPEHPFFVLNRGEYRPATELIVNEDILLGIDGAGHLVTQLTREHSTAPVSVYNIEVAENHNYYVRGGACSFEPYAQPDEGTSVLVHNCDVKEGLVEELPSAFREFRDSFFEGIRDQFSLDPASIQPVPHGTTGWQLVKLGAERTFNRIFLQPFKDSIELWQNLANAENGRQVGRIFAHEVPGVMLRLVFKGVKSYNSHGAPAWKMQDKVSGQTVPAAPGLSVNIGRLHHINTNHNLTKFAEQAGKMPHEDFVRKLENKTFFNKTWDETKIAHAVDRALKEAQRGGVKPGKFTTRIFDEEITVYFDNSGNFRSAWGNHRYTLQDLGL